MNKQTIVQLIIRQLEADIQVAQQAVDIARDTATHKDCLGSSKYETMGTEASYLAKGQGERLLELQRALAYFKQADIQPRDCIKPLSLLILEDEGGNSHTYLLAGDAGGLKVCHEKHMITVITAQAPLGKALLGKQVGDDVEIQVAGKAVCYEVLSIQ